jgi:hypothetical protein
MTTREYEGSAVYYVVDLGQLAFPLRRTGSSVPESLIHRMRDKAFGAEMVYEVPPPPAADPRQMNPVSEGSR